MVVNTHLSKRLGRKGRDSRRKCCQQHRRCAIESLESRQLLSITLPSISSQTVLTGAPLNVVLNGSESSGHALTYSATVTSLTLSGGSLTAAMSSSSNPSLKLSISDAGDNLSGDVVFQLFKDLAPETVDHIMALVNAGEYDNTTFHRIIENFMIQGGAGISTGAIDDEFNAALQFTGPGILAMANANSSTASDTGGSQFFITTEATRWLDFRYSIFGIVTQNYNLVDKLDSVPTSSGDVPDNTVTITDAQIITDTQNGVLRLSAPTGASGMAYVTVTATDTVTKATKSTSFLVTVSADTNNDQPFLKAIDPITTSANTPTSFTIPATDVEGDAIIYSAVVEPTNSNISVSVNSSTGVVTVTPTNNAYGVFSIKVGVARTTSLVSTDKADFQYVPVYVSPAKPTVVTLATASDTGSSDSDGVTSLNNSNGKTLHFQVDGVLAGALVQLYAGNTLIGSATVDAGATSVTITTNGTTTLADGTYSITATQTLESQTVSVGNLSTTTDLVSLRSSGLAITVDTTPPQFYFPVPTTAVVGVPYEAHLAVAEGSLGGVTYQLISNPDGMSLEVILNLVTLITWTPTALQVGPANVTVEATDPAGNTAQITYSINVLASNSAPVLSDASPDLGTTNLPVAKTIAVADFVTNVTDADANAVLGGIALSGTGGVGIWEYSLDGGTTFRVINSALETNALLLPRDALLRYTPQSVGSDVATITYHAWDTTGDAAGGRANLSAAGATGGSTAYSVATNTASLEVIGTCSISGYVYLDSDNDGRRITPSSQPHAGIQGVTVAISTFIDGGWSSPIATTTTDADGSYHFNDLTPGVYLIQETQAAGFLDGKETLGTVAGKTKGQIGPDVFAIRLTGGDVATEYNFGERRPDASCYLAPDPLDAKKTALYVYGTSGNDTIVVNPGNAAGDVKVVLNGVSRGTFHPTSRIIVHGLAGKDSLGVSSNVALPAWLYGDAGNDSLSGGGGPNVLLGGAGKDTLTGGKGRSLLIGGTDSDSLSGGSGDAVFIGGTTDYDANDRALLTILNEWKSGAAAKTRMAHLTGTSGGLNKLDGAAVFLDRVSVHDDAANDALVGGSGANLFLQGAADTLQNKHSADVTVKAATTFALSGPTSGTYTVGENVTIRWAANYVGAGSKVSLCYDPDAVFGNSNQTWIVVDRALTTAGDGAYVWNTTGVKPGKYYLGGYVWSNGKATFSHLTKPITIVAPSAPTGYSVEANDSVINAAEAASAGFTLHNAQVGAVYNCTVSSSSGGSAIVLTGNVTAANQSVPVDVSPLPDGTLTFAVTLTKGLTGAVATATAALDRTAPTGYSIASNAALVNASTVGFTFTGAEVGATYSYTIVDESNNTIGPVTGTVTSATQSVTGIDVSSLTDGHLVISATLTDAAGNGGSTVTATAQLDRVAPAGYAIAATSDRMNAATIGFTFAKAELGTTYECFIADSASHTIGPITGTINSATQSVSGMDVSSLADGSLTFYVFLTDAAGNQGIIISTTGVLDRTPPTGYDVAIASLTNAATIGFTLTGAEANATYTYTITDSQGHAVGPVTGPVNSSISQTVGGIDVSSLSDGLLTLSVTLTDAAGNAGAAVVASTTLDRTAPTGYTVTTPSVAMNDTTIGFTIDGAEVGAAYRYTISDGVHTVGPTTGVITAATQTINGMNVSSLDEGPITISLTLIDTAGNEGIAATTAAILDRMAPAGYSITVPSTDITSSTATDTSFTFVDAELGAHYVCIVSSDSGFASVTKEGDVASANETISGIDVSTLPPGTLTYYVMLTDAAGNVGLAVTAIRTLSA
jgi:cyclophilin family peptidyl-prolyl cis-trans isomerase